MVDISIKFNQVYLMIYYRPCYSLLIELQISNRDIEWSLRAFASMQAARLILRARVVINFLMRAASTLETTNGE